MSEELFFAASSSIDIYPWSSDRSVDLSEQPNSISIDRHVLSEENLKLLWSNFTDNPFYVLSYDFTGDQTKFIKFVMYGYYFHLSDQTLLNNPNLWVTCAISTDDPPYNTLKGFSSEDGTASENAGTDPDGNFTGLKFSTTAPYASDAHNWLHLIETTSEGVKRVPNKSMFKFSAKSIASIDGGTV